MDNKRVRMTLLLDDKTIKALKQFSYERIGETNVSKAVMLMVKEHEQGLSEQRHTGKVTI